MFTLFQIVFRAIFRVSPPGPAARVNRAATPLLLCVFCTMLLVLYTAPTLASETQSLKGRASWYGTTAHGMQTANGETYNKFALTAAHKGLPFGTVVRVRNLENGKQVLVRVNDRGPFVKGRIVDVSRRAAELLNMTSSGVVPVSLEIIGNSSGSPLNEGNGFYVHIDNAPGVFKARELMAAIGGRLGVPLRALAVKRNGKQFYALCSGPFDTFSEAQRHFLKLEKKNLQLRGIIEGPTQEHIFAPVNAPSAACSTDSVVASTVYTNPMDAISALLQPAVSITPVFPIKNGLLILSAMQNTLPGFRMNVSLLYLPYQAVFGTSTSLHSCNL